MTTLKDHSDNIWIVHRACNAASMGNGQPEWIEEAILEPNSTTDTRMIPLRFFYEVRSEAFKMAAQLAEIRGLVASEQGDVAKRILRIIDEGPTPLRWSL